MGWQPVEKVVKVETVALFRCFLCDSKDAAAEPEIVHHAEGYGVKCGSCGSYWISSLVAGVVRTQWAGQRPRLAAAVQKINTRKGRPMISDLEAILAEADSLAP